MLRRLVAPLGTIALLALVVRALLWVSGPSLTVIRDGTATFDDTLGALAALGAWLLVGWMMLVLVGTALAALPGTAGRAGSRAVSVITPIAARRTARMALGLAVAAGPVMLSAGPALAYGPGMAGSGPVVTDVVTDASDLPLIERPTRPDQTPRPAAPLSVAALQNQSPEPQTTSSQPTAETTGGEPTPEATGSEPSAQAPERDQSAAARPVVVQTGDSLWTIAARLLGPGASDAEIAAEWPRWYEANRDVIGEDADLIMPGTELSPPSPR